MRSYLLPYFALKNPASGRPIEHGGAVADKKPKFLDGTRVRVPGAHGEVVSDLGVVADSWSVPRSDDALHIPSDRREMAEL